MGEFIYFYAPLMVVGVAILLAVVVSATSKRYEDES